MFECDLETILIPELKPDDVMIRGNLKPHRSEEAIEAAGAEVVPPWRPGPAPIEEMLSNVKDSMRSAAERIKEAVYAAFGSALHDVTTNKIARWFHDRAVYVMQQRGDLESHRHFMFK